MKSSLLILLVLCSIPIFGQSKDIKLFPGFAPDETITMVETVNVLKDENGLTDRHISNVSEQTCGGMVERDSQLINPVFKDKYLNTQK